MTFKLDTPIIALNMKVLKGCGLGLLGFILFLCLTVFGIAYTVNQVALNPAFITAVINDIDFSETAQQVLAQQEGEGPPPELVEALIDTLDKTEPVIKEKLVVVIEDTYDYLLGTADSPDIRATMRDSFFNSQFLDSVLQSIDLSQIVDEYLKEQSPAGDEASKQLMNSFLSTVNKLEPSLKKQIVAASDPVFKYVLSETNTIDLKGTLRNTVLTRDFMVEVINALDIKSITRDMVGDELDISLPDGIMLTRTEKDQIITALEPAVKSGLAANADPIADYLLGIRSSFNVTISLNPVMPTAKSIVRQAFLRQLPPELITATTAQIDQAFELFWTEAQSSIPASFDLDSGMFGIGISNTFDQGLTSARDVLTEMRDKLTDIEQSIVDKLDPVRPYIRIFRMAFWGLTILLLLIIGGIILIHRSVRGAARDLGITFTTYGAMLFAGVFILRSIVGNPDFFRQYIESDMPAFLDDVIPNIVNILTQPLFTFTLICLTLGIILLVVSFVYPKKKTFVMVEQEHPERTA